MNLDKPKLACKLTSQALQQRKKTVIVELKSLVSQKTETQSGYKYRFPGSDATLDLLNDFIKTERLCCDFFIFNLTASNEEQSIWLELSGPEGTKDFIRHEIEF